MVRRRKPTRQQVKLNRAAGMVNRTGKHSRFNGNLGWPSLRSQKRNDPKRLEAIRKRQAEIAEHHRKRGLDNANRG